MPQFVPFATDSSPGAVQPDGLTILATGPGIIHAATATVLSLGMVKPDDVSITIDPDGTIHASPPSPPEEPAGSYESTMVQDVTLTQFATYSAIAVTLPAGTWVISGQVCVENNDVSSADYYIKLWNLGSLVPRVGRFSVPAGIFALVTISAIVTLTTTQSIWLAVNTNGPNQFLLSQMIDPDSGNSFPATSMWAIAEEPLTPSVWLTNQSGTPTVGLFSADATFAGDLATTALANLHGAVKVGADIWSAVYNGASSAVHRLHQTGASAGVDLTGNGLLDAYSIAVVGSEVWVTDGAGLNNGAAISRFNADGTVAGSPITDGYLSAPSDLAVVGSTVWVVNQAASPPFGTLISRYNFDGSSAGDPLSIPSSPAGGIAVVGTEVWVGTTTGHIQRFKASDGTSAGADITPFGMGAAAFIRAIGTQVWVVDTTTNNLFRFLFDTTQIDKRSLVPYGLSFPRCPVHL